MIKDFKYFGKCFFLVPFLCLFFFISPVSADETVDYLENNYQIGEQTLERGITFSFENGQLLLPIFPKKISTPFHLKVVREDRKYFSLPEDYRLATEIFTIQTDEQNGEAVPLTLIFKIGNGDFWGKELYSFDMERGWQRFVGATSKNDKITVTTANEKITLAVLQSKGPMTVGRASWYKYKNCDCAASPDIREHC